MARKMCGAPLRMGWRFVYKKPYPIYIWQNEKSLWFPLEQSEQGLRCSLIDPYGICWIMVCENDLQSE